MAGRVMQRIGVVLAGVLVLALAATLVFSLYGRWRAKRAEQRFEAVLGKPEMSRFLRPEVAEADNAATWLTAGAGAVVSINEIAVLTSAPEERDAWWDDEEIARAQRLVEDNAPALELLRRAAGCSASSYSLDYLDGPGVELPPLVELLRAGRLLWIDARLALAAAEGPRLRADLATLDRLADSLAEESLLVTALLAGGIDRYYLDLVHRVVSGGGEDLELLGAVEAALAGRDRQAEYLRSLAAEGSMLFALLPDHALALEGVEPPGWSATQLSRLPGPVLLAALLDEYSAVADLVDKPWPEVVAASDERARQGFPRSFAVTLYPSLIDGLGKLKAGQSADRLALEAVRQRLALLTDGAYQSTVDLPPVDPYAGLAPRFERRSDGSIVLEAPGALDLWRARHPRRSGIGDPRFLWELPPPARGD